MWGEKGVGKIKAQGQEGKGRQGGKVGRREGKEGKRAGKGMCSPSTTTTHTSLTTTVCVCISHSPTHHSTLQEIRKGGGVVVGMKEGRQGRGRHVAMSSAVMPVSACPSLPVCLPSHMLCYSHGQRERENTGRKEPGSFRRRWER